MTLLCHQNRFFTNKEEGNNCFYMRGSRQKAIQSEFLKVLSSQRLNAPVPHCSRVSHGPSQALLRPLRPQITWMCPHWNLIMCPFTYCTTRAHLPPSTLHKHSLLHCMGAPPPLHHARHVCAYMSMFWHQQLCESRKVQKLVSLPRGSRGLSLFDF